jgi:hypothetical protein
MTDSKCWDTHTKIENWEITTDGYQRHAGDWLFAIRVCNGVAFELSAFTVGSIEIIGTFTRMEFAVEIGDYYAEKAIAQFPPAIAAAKGD